MVRQVNKLDEYHSIEKMKVGLSIPCYIDQFYPQVALQHWSYWKNPVVKFLFR